MFFALRAKLKLKVLSSWCTWSFMYFNPVFSFVLRAKSEIVIWPFKTLLLSLYCKLHSFWEVSRPKLRASRKTIGYVLFFVLRIEFHAYFCLHASCKIFQVKLNLYIFLLSLFMLKFVLRPMLSFSLFRMASVFFFSLLARQTCWDFCTT